MRASGFPAIKFFKSNVFSLHNIKGYLLIAGGFDPATHRISESVKLYEIIFEKLVVVDQGG